MFFQIPAATFIVNFAQYYAMLHAQLMAYIILHKMVNDLILKITIF